MKRNQRGYTILEMVIATFIALVVVLGMGRLILANQKFWKMGQDKMVLQQNVTEALEWMARSVRGARTLEVTEDELRTYNESGDLVHTYAFDSSNNQLLEDGEPLVARKCISFEITPDDDTTSVTLELELEDDSFDKVAAVTRAAVRNRFLEF